MTLTPEYRREWYAKNPDKVVAARARYRAKQDKRELERNGSLAYWRENKGDYAARLKAWRAANPEKYRAQQARSYAKRSQDPAYRLSASVRASLHKALRGERKSKPTFKMLGYSLDQLIAHLEPQFLPGMTWENYGAWHVDHRKPVVSFILPDQIVECFALSNLQPLWALDNISKGSR
jgi:hypothetical protein